MIFVQSEATAARRRFPVYLVDATDGITPETGEGSGQPQISKNGGAWGNTSATLTAVGNGSYYVELTATELDTAGGIAIRYKSANTAEFNAPASVVAANLQDSVRLGLTALPNAAADAAGGLPISDAGGLDLDTFLGRITANVATATALSTAQTDLDTLTGSDGVTLATSQPNYAPATASALGDVDTDVNLLLTRLGTPSDLGSGASVAANLVDIESQTDDIGAAGAGLTAVPWNAAWDAEVQSEVNDGLVAYGASTLTQTQVTGGAYALNSASFAFNAALDLTTTQKASVNTAADTALSDIHLDHLFATDYDPASKPGTATALLNELVENDGGVSRFTANALEQAPSGGTNPNILEDTTVASISSQTVFVLSAGADFDDAYNDQTIVLYDASNNDYPSVRVVTDYVGSTKTVTIDSAPDFTLAASGDGVKIFATAPGTSAPTAAQVADAVWDEPIGDHQTLLSTGNTLFATFSEAESAANDAAELLGDWQNGGRLDLILDAILADTNEIGAAGAGLTAVPYNSAWTTSNPLVIASGTIGSVGNSTTTLHLAGVKPGNDELNDQLIKIYDDSAGEIHFRWIEDWDDAGDLATVATLPFTPQNATDTYVIFGIRRDVDAVRISNSATAANNLETAATGGSYNLGGGGVVAASVTGAVGSVTGNVSGNVTGSIGSLATQAKADVNAEADTAISDAALATASALTTVDGNVDAIKAVTDNLPDSGALTSLATASALSTLSTAVADVPTNAELATALSGLNDPSAATIAAAVLAAGDVDGYTLEQTLKLCLAALAGKLSGAATTTVVVRSADDSANRITATVDSDGNRSAVTLNAAG